ncbi:hypothetical protein AT728_02340 [Streptomyces silvensis]|uniref:Uncharacterized protein n=2 Tax=Streptomyces silvensis TaxID=1765722 RepID=A0A0W7WU79_9ACTN|nr:hypothetical protein AT728_02340 [Streptomyces silvensis]
MHGLLLTDHRMLGRGRLLRGGGGCLLRSLGSVLRGTAHLRRGSGHILRGPGCLLRGLGSSLRGTAHLLRDSDRILPGATRLLHDTLGLLNGVTNLRPGVPHLLLGATLLRGTTLDLGKPRPPPLPVGSESPPDGSRAGVRVGGARLLPGLRASGGGTGTGTASTSGTASGPSRPGASPHGRTLPPLRHLRLAPRALSTRHQQQVVVLGGVVGRVEEGVRGRRGDARLLHPACALRQSLTRDLAGVGHAYPSPIG